MPKKKKKTKGRWDYVENHHADIWRELQIIFQAEHWNATLSDRKLSDRVRDAAVYCTPGLARDVRMEHGVGNADQRRIELFKKQNGK